MSGSFERPPLRIIRCGDSRRVRSFGRGGPETAHTYTRTYARACTCTHIYVYITCRESAWSKHFRVVRLMNHLRWPSPFTLLPDTLLPSASPPHGPFDCRFSLAIRLLIPECLSEVLESAIRSDLIDTSRPAFDNASNADWRTHIRAIIICSFDKILRHLQDSVPSRERCRLCVQIHVW